MPNFSKKNTNYFLWIPDTKEIYVKLFIKLKKKQNPHKTAATGRGGAGDARAHVSRVPRQNETAPASHAERNGGSSASHPLLVDQPGPPRAVPLSFAHGHAALLGGGHAAWASRPPT